MTQLSTALITRSQGPVVIDAIYAASLEGLQNALSGSSAVTSWVVADLSLGAWKSHQVASELFLQLGLLLPALDTAKAPVFSRFDVPPSYAGTIAAGIDAESRGDRATLSALELATRIVAAVMQGMPRTFIILAPRYGLPWERENELFIQFLAQGLQQNDSRLLLVYSDPDPAVIHVSSNWTLHWLNTLGPSPAAPSDIGLPSMIPGIVEPEVAAVLEMRFDADDGKHLALAAGCRLVAPECRHRPEDIPRFDYDQLAARCQSFLWLRTYAQYYGNDLYVDSTVLTLEAWRRFAEGSPNLALRLIDRARGCAHTTLEHGFYLCGAQGMRLGLRRFAEVAESPDPSPDLSSAVKGFLLQAKGWGMVMMGDALHGEVYLRQARDLLEPDRSVREVAYLWNIHALSRLKLGDLQGALALERQIEASRAQQVRQDWQLEYVNSINQARLYRQLGDFDAAERYYHRAFATTLGVRSESDAIYSNVCLARLEMERTEPMHAFLYWFRASLHWLACHVPEALAPRVVTSILRRNLSSDQSSVEDVSAALHSLLLASAVKALPFTVDELELDTESMPVIGRFEQLFEDLAPGRIDRAIGGPGWSVLVTDMDTSAVFDGPHYRRLKALVYMLLRSMLPDTMLPHRMTLIVDHRLGREMATNACELLETCVRLRVPHMQFDNYRLDLEDDVLKQLEMEMRVRLADAVDQVFLVPDKAIVTFKRYFAPRILSTLEGQIVKVAESQPSLTQLLERFQDEGVSVLKVVRALEKARVINLYLLEEICIQLVSNYV